MTRFRSRCLVALALALMLLAGACGGDNDAGAGVTSTTRAKADAGDQTDQDDQSGQDGLQRRDADIEVPRAVTYAGVQIEVTGAEWSNASPATYGRPEPSVGGDTLLFLDLTVRFLSGYPGDDSFLPVRNFVIETTDGDRRGATGVDHLAEVAIRASAATKAVLAFEITEDELDGAVLVYDDTTRVAAHLPLTGAVDPSPYPVRVDMNEVGVPHLKTGCEPTTAEVQLVAVEWDVDGGVGENGARLAAGRSSRASIDHRWLRADLEVAAGTGQCGGTFANSESFRVVVDGKAQAPVNTYSLTLADGQVAPMIFLFEVPVDAAEVVFEAGPDPATSVSFPIEVPTFP